MLSNTLDAAANDLRLFAVLPAYEALSATEQLDLGPLHRKDFNFRPVRFLMGVDVPLSPDNDELVVYKNCYFQDSFVRTDCQALNWEVFTRFFVVPTASRASDETSRHAVPKDLQRQLMMDFPWLRGSGFRSIRRGVVPRAHRVPAEGVEGVGGDLGADVVEHDSPEDFNGSALPADPPH